jgi:hypothetical protein
MGWLAQANQQLLRHLQHGLLQVDDSELLSFALAIIQIGATFT